MDNPEAVKINLDKWMTNVFKNVNRFKNLKCKPRYIHLVECIDTN